MRTRSPRQAKVRAPSVGGRSGVAFGGGGGTRAFRDPATMVAPDQAFSGAMAAPQGGAAAPTSAALPAVMPGATPGPTG